MYKSESVSRNESFSPIQNSSSGYSTPNSNISHGSMNSNDQYENLILQVQQLNAQLKESRQTIYNYQKNYDELERYSKKLNEQRRILEKELLEKNEELLNEKNKTLILENVLNEMKHANKEDYLNRLSDLNQKDLEIQSLNFKINEMKNEFQLKLQSYQSEYHSKLNEMKTSYEQKIFEVENTNQKLMDEIKNKEKFIDDIKKVHESNINVMKLKLEQQEETIKNLQEDVSLSKKRNFSDMNADSFSTLESIKQESIIRELRHQLDVYKEASKMLPGFRKELEKLMHVEEERDRLMVLCEMKKVEKDITESEKKTMKVLRFHKSPEIMREEGRLKSKLEDLEKHISNLEEQLEISKMDDKINIINDLKSIIEKQKKELEDALVLKDRITEAAKVKISEYTTLVKNLFGWTITLEGTKGTLFKLTFTKATNPNNYLSFKFEKNELIMLETEFSKSLPQELLDLLSQNPLYVFMSKLTLALLGKK